MHYELKKPQNTQNRYTAYNKDKTIQNNEIPKLVHEQRNNTRHLYTSIKYDKGADTSSAPSSIKKSTV